MAEVKPDPQNMEVTPLVPVTHEKLEVVSPLSSPEHMSAGGVLLPNGKSFSASATKSRLVTTIKAHRVAIYPFGFTWGDIKRAIITLIVLYVAYMFLAQVQAIVTPFVVAIFLAALLEPMIAKNEARGIKRGRTILTLCLLAIMVFVLVIVAVVPRAYSQFTDIAEKRETYYQNFKGRADTFLKKNSETLKKIGVKQDSLDSLLNERTSPVRATLNRVLAGVTEFVQGLAGKALWLIIVPIASLFLMLDFPRVRRRCISLFPEDQQAYADVVSSKIVSVFSDYIRGLAKICTIFGIAACLLFGILGLQYWLVLGIIAGLFYAVPYVGQLLTATAVGAVAYTMDTHKIFFFIDMGGNSILYAVTCVGCQVLMNNVFDQVVMPRVVGGAVGLHPVVSLFAVTAGATAFGIPGMLLAMPIASSIQIMLKELYPKLKTPAPETFPEIQAAT